MQRITTSEVRVSGPTSFSAALPQPPTKLGFYRDIAVLAFPASDAKATIENIEAKAGFNGDAVLSARNAGDSAAGAIPLGEVIDLASNLTADGKLNWQAPAGEWVILRLGYTPIGMNNHPAPRWRRAGMRQVQQDRARRALGRLHAKSARRHRPAGRQDAQLFAD